ncbi:hypothetical protein B0H14DRAFT_2571025 [Mycena olivaceomarginata]|nr:hypothetical protein B0H14DRAFT_2571025 [Mycena olivaceomarginata]
MQIFPLLLQLSLLLFSTALSIYLWTIHHIIATIALSLTGLGSFLYAGMVISAVLSPDSPFQTSLSFVLKAVLKKFSIPRMGHQWFRGYWTDLLIPLHTTYTVFSHPPAPSPEASAAMWVLETSTDPRLVETTAELIPELQWPSNLDFQQAQKRLDDTFGSCMQQQDWYFHVCDGMVNRATACIRAFWVFDMVTPEGQRTPDLWTSGFPVLKQHTSKELSSIKFWRHRPFNMSHSAESITPLTLRFIAAYDLPETVLETFLENFNLIPSGSEIDNKLIYADFLFSLVSFFHPTTARDRSVQDKV